MTEHLEVRPERTSGAATTPRAGHRTGDVRRRALLTQVGLGLALLVLFGIRALGRLSPWHPFRATRSAARTTRTRTRELATFLDELGQRSVGSIVADAALGGPPPRPWPRATPPSSPPPAPTRAAHAR